MKTPDKTIKSDLVRDAAERSRKNKTLTKKVVDTFLDAIQAFLSTGREIQLRGFGTFSVKKRSKRICRNPKKPEQIVILPERVVPIVKFTQSLIQRVSGFRRGVLK